MPDGYVLGRRREVGKEKLYEMAVCASGNYHRCCIVYLSHLFQRGVQFYQ